jgi:ketosteroid isomerase-like protein
MSDSDVTHDLISRFFRCVNSQDFEGFAGLLDENVDFMMIGSTPLSGAAHNRNDMMAVVARVGDYVDENFIQLEELDRVVEGNRGVMRSLGRGRTRKGELYENTYMHMIRVKDGVIVEFLEYLDTDLINRVLIGT